MSLSQLTHLKIESPYLYALIITVVTLVFVVVIGWIIHSFCKVLATILAKIISPGFAFGLINYFMFPGTIIHELSHALFAFITGAKVVEVVVFKPSGDSLGHVSFKNRGNIVFRSIQNVLTSAAPVMVGLMIIFLFYTFFPQICTLALWMQIIIYYLVISVFFHMSMSTMDAIVYAKGLPVMSIIVYILVIAFILLQKYHVI